MARGLLFIHGFLSSPQSVKAQLTLDYVSRRDLAIHCRVPALPNTPADSWRVLESELRDALAHCDRVGLIGSSLGGFFATALAEKYALPAVLINPAVAPHRLIRHFPGSHQNPHTGETFVIGDAHMHELEALQPARLTAPERLWVLLQSGDETLDYRDAQTYYSACRMTLEEGGDHHFQGYERHLPAILDFLQLAE